MAIGVLGDTSIGSHQAVMTDLLDPLSSNELSQLASSAEVCSFGPATGLARASHCLAVVPTSLSPLLLQEAVVAHLMNFESTRLCTEVFFHSTIGYKAQ